MISTCRVTRRLSLYKKVYNLYMAGDRTRVSRVFLSPALASVYIMCTNSIELWVHRSPIKHLRTFDSCIAVYLCVYICMVAYFVCIGCMTLSCSMSYLVKICCYIRLYSELHDSKFINVTYKMYIFISFFVLCC